MALEAGQQLGVYEIIRPLGAGGMGEVYLGRDPKLDRLVAIKVLPEVLTREPEQVARFEREARLLATLNHPNIAAVHGFDALDGVRFLVMEYVEGETLAHHLAQGGLAIDDTLEIMRQIAHALEAAHDSGVIHRDLKPGNVMVDADGVVKVLDFGLAKAASDDPSGSMLADSPTITAHYTRPGVVLGTAAYMSPEQARGRAVDKRTDIWSFGVVLYECLTGASPFSGETVSDSIGAILHKDIDLADIPTATPSNVRRVLQRCLERDRKARLRDIGDARIELERVDVVAPAVLPTASRGPTWLLVGGLVLMALVVGVVAGWRTARPQVPALRHVTVEPPLGKRVHFSGDLAGPPVVSPDGTMVVFVASAPGEDRMLWIRRLDEPAAGELDGTAGALFPFWAPDNSAVAFFTTDTLRRIDLASETVMTVCSVDESRGGAWTRDGRIILAPGFRTPLELVDVTTGARSPLTTLDEALHTTHRWPVALPDGEHYLFLAAHRDAQKRENNGLYLGHFDGRAPRRIMRADFGAAYADDWLLFVREDVVMASRLDLESARLTGDTHVIARDVAADLSTWHGQFSVSDAGVIVFNSTGDATPNTESLQAVVGGYEGDRITLMGPSGRPLTHYADGWPIMDMRVSPDGSRMIISAHSKNGSLDLWLHPTRWIADADDTAAQTALAEHMHSNPTRFTFLEGSEDTPIWSPSGDAIAFSWHDSPPGTAGIYRKRIGGGREELLLPAGERAIFPQDWSPDGRFIVYVDGPYYLSTGNSDIWALPLEGGDPVSVVQSEYTEYLPALSPDGRWLAYTMTRAGQAEVYVVPFTPAWPEAAPTGQWQISMSGGRHPRWRPDGRVLHYISPRGLLMSVAVTSGDDRLQFDSPKPMFQTPYDTGSSYDVSPARLDGTHQYYFTDTQKAPDAPISVILNWQRRLPD